MSDEFADRLAAMVASEMKNARKDPDRIAHAIERLSAALGFAVAMGAGGDPKGISTLMSGAEAYAMEEAVEKAPIAAMMRRLAG